MESYINKIFNTDCLAGMSMYSDHSIDMILSDLPYGITDCRWDKPYPIPESLVSVSADYQGKRCNRSDGSSAIHDETDFQSAKAFRVLLLLVQKHGDGLYIC